MTARRESCARCRYYDAAPHPRGETAEAYSWPKDGLGMCLRFPTAITKAGSSWCGEFTPPQDDDYGPNDGHARTVRRTPPQDAATTRGEG